MLQDFSMTNPSPFPTWSSGNGLLCLSGKNAGFSPGGDGWGKSMITPTTIQIYGEDRGAPLDVRQGTSRAPPPLFRASQSKCLAEQTPSYPLLPCFFVFLLCTSLCALSYGKAVCCSPVQP
ncbi:hypothetical protein ATANTOWER_016105 [Ataeniobius toweri]|uniref:Uncharacterized protein n=1 Tax=Ataeniobius toweri TaxID=208326 RepID=A0ABU7BE35_9TELE|nr:hypothetical protein [Ataeniobius toweri]